jgi:hypothetical protein
MGKKLFVPVCPPKIQKFPAVSAQLIDPNRAPGMLPGSGDPFTPYVPG